MDEKTIRKLASEYDKANAGVRRQMFRWACWSTIQNHHFKVETARRADGTIDTTAFAAVVEAELAGEMNAHEALPPAEQRAWYLRLRTALEA